MHCKLLCCSALFEIFLMHRMLPISILPNKVKNIKGRKNKANYKYIWLHHCTMHLSSFCKNSIRDVHKCCTGAKQRHAKILTSLSEVRESNPLIECLYFRSRHLVDFDRRHSFYESKCDNYGERILTPDQGHRAQEVAKNCYL